ncbi:CHAT domain protein [Leptospira ryugenii]|uniref:CHAT domain protein n=1 Tax=Leptospira ryugenii TaxID=1917863 RepID=A0A2P2DVU5_9LEPT|nr:CHAT domain-containing protein [Leptospira ryugenii]GBF48727.1 CHAT domain protein [Leptospira ryugenii]
MIVRVLAKPSRSGEPNSFDGELIWDDLSLFSPVEEVHYIDGLSLWSFYEEWIRFYQKTQSIKPKREEWFNLLQKKSDTLEQILFGKKIPPWKSKNFREPIFLQSDPEFFSIPFEILKTKKAYFYEYPFFYRGIRGQAIGHSQAKPKKFLCLENPVLPNLEESVKQEAKSLSLLFEDDTRFQYKRIPKEQCKISKFWEEILSSDLIHYTGHSDINGIPFPSEGKSLQNEIGQANLSHIHCAYINSCYSAYEGAKQSGLASQFLKAGAKYVIGFLTPIETETAKEISLKFWREYLISQSISQAYRKTKDILVSDPYQNAHALLSLVFFAPETKSTNRKYVFGFLLGLLLLLGVYFLPKEKNELNEPKKEERPLLEEAKPKESQANLSLEKRISKVNLTKFRNALRSFLTDEHPIYSKKERIEIIEDILGSNMNEEMQFYQFKMTTGQE